MMRARCARESAWMPEPRITIFDYGAGNLHSLAKAVAS